MTLVAIPGAASAEASISRVPRGPGEDEPSSVPCQGNRNGVYDENGNYLWDVGVIIGRKCVVFHETLYLINGSTMLPMRELLQRMNPGYYENVTFAKWFPEHQTACADETSNVICYPIGRSYVYWNGVIQPIRQPAVVINGRTRIPFRDLIEKSGGKVDWDGETRTISVDLSTALHIWAKPDDICRLMGLDPAGNCDADRVIAGHYVYKAWGTDFVIERMLDGTLQQPGMTAYLNKIGIGKKGAPLEGPQLKWTEAILNTGIDLLTAVWIGSELRFAKSVRGTVSPAGRELLLDASAAEGKHAVHFWAKRSSVSEHALKYQVRGDMSLIRVVDGKREAVEYAWRNVAFDHKLDVGDGVRIFLERKSDAGYVARLSKYAPEFRTNLMDDFADEIFRQFRALRGEPKVVLSWEVETAELQVLVQEALDHRVFAKLTEEYGTSAASMAFEELKEVFRLSVQP